MIRKFLAMMLCLSVTTPLMAAQGDDKGKPFQELQEAVDQAVAAETAAREAADDAQNAALAAEAAAREAADQVLQDVNDAQDAALIAEAAAREAADDAQSAALSAETAARTAADQVLQDVNAAQNAALAAETAARIAADSAEAAARQTADDAEAAARAAADTAEALARIAGDEAINTRIDGLTTEVQTINNTLTVITGDVSNLEIQVADNATLLASVQVGLNASNQEVEQLRADMLADIARIDAEIESINDTIAVLEGGVQALTTELATQVGNLQGGIDANTAQLALNTAQLVLAMNNINSNTGRIDQLEADLSALEVQIASMDTRLHSVELLAHAHIQPGSCAEILADNPTSTNGFYDIDPDGAGPDEPITAFCDMDHGGWTNFNFATNQILLENNNVIDCDTMSVTNSSVTCNLPLFNKDAQPDKKYLYHYFCSGQDPEDPQSMQYLVDHVSLYLGHKSSQMLGFATQINYYERGASSYQTDNEYCYVDGEVVHWRDPKCATYNFHGNGSCVPGTFTLSL